MVEIHLSDEEKIQILLLALGLFLLALILSICLASTLCPLNSWLLNRSEKKRLRKLQQLSQQQQQHQQQHHHHHQQQHYFNFNNNQSYLRSSFNNRHYLNNNHHQQANYNYIGSARNLNYFSNQRLCQQNFVKASSLASSYIGPPPAYEQALRATRLQSLTGSLYSQDSIQQQQQQQQKPPPPSPSTTSNWDEFNFNKQKLDQLDNQIDFGDYFHQPKDSAAAVATTIENDNNLMLNCDIDRKNKNGSTHKPTRPPVMLRLWVKVLDPNELVIRAKSQDEEDEKKRKREELAGSTSNCESLANSACSTIRRLSLANRQLSIPQFFGSLVSSIAATSQINYNSVIDAGADEKSIETLEKVKVHRSSSYSLSSNINDKKEEVNSNKRIDDDDDCLSLGGDKKSNFTSVSVVHNKEQNEDERKLAAAEAAAPISISSSGNDSSPKLSINNSIKSSLKEDTNNYDNPYRPSSGILNTISSITSRVLHMNVASFSYVKDESLISTKKHKQLNFNQFYVNNNNNQETCMNNNNNNNNNTGLSKSCQLMISICDIENILISSSMNEKSCALLSNNSAIYVQCEILLPKSKSERLLGPLTKALPGNNNNLNSNSKRHTVNFESVISASAVESRPIHSQQQQQQQPQLQQTSIANQLNSNTFGGAGAGAGDESIIQDESLNKISLSTTTTTCSSNNSNVDEQKNSINQPQSTNWRHEPNADGRSIVVFSSVPKEIAHQQQLTASVSPNINYQFSDLIQFDSVFISPILNRSTIENGFIRFKIYSQCKYVNETCLAELKLPLKQLLNNETNDNLNDAFNSSSSSSSSFNNNNNSLKQADFILNNLLKNLVTASTGSPLSTLIEQISSEEREAKQELEREINNSTSNNNPLKSLFPWSLATTTTTNQNVISTDNNNKGLRGSSSFNDSLYRLTSKSQQQTSINNNDNKLLIEETERRIEENYYRSLMVSHWLNYLIAPSYECQLLDEPKGKIILGLSYLPTSNRVIFNAHRALIDDDSYSNGKQLMKNLRLQTGTCYLLRFLMIVNGRVIKRKQTPIGKKPEWDSQEPITFDLVSISVDQPSFIVALVMRNSTGSINSGSLQNLRSTQQQQVCNCGLSNHHKQQQQQRQQQLVLQSTIRAHQHQQHHHLDVQSEPESLQHYGSTYRTGTILDGFHNNINNNNNNNNNKYRRHNQERDLVIGHLVLSDEIWKEMRAQPRKQIVKQFKMY